MKAGAASIVINNDLGTVIQGAGVPDQRVEAIHDDLEANALYLVDGETAVLFVSCDLAGLETARVQSYTRAMAAAANIDADAIIIGCTHTHGGPVVLHTDYLKPVDEAYSERLQDRLCRVATEAVNSVVPARIGWSMGHARLGYNRRVCYADGGHSMHRQAGRDDDYTGLEGPDDTECMALAVFDKKNNITAILHHGTGHPSSFYAQRVLSAEFPGVARRLIREACGRLPVLFFNGALGDIGMTQQAAPQRVSNTPESQIIRLGSTLAGETLRLIHEMHPQDNVTLMHQRHELKLPVRLPTTDAVEQGRAVLARIEAGEDICGMDAIFAWGSVSLMDRFGANPVDRQTFHAIRLGDLAIATHPFELFCQYQLDLKLRSPTRSTACFALTGGYGGYLPTLAAALGGGYSGTPLAWTRFAPEVGCQVIDHAAARLHAIWVDAEME